MAAKIHNFNSDGHKIQTWAFICPGCGYSHAFTVGPKFCDADHRWTFNGNVESPTFTPSLRVNGSTPDAQCHLEVADGQIKYHGDCFHALAGKTVPMIDWDS